MANTIRENIFQNIKTTIQGIVQKNGYENNIEPENVLIIHGKRDDSAYKEPVIYIYPGTEKLNFEKCEKGKEYNELEIQIEVWLRSEKSSMNSNINKMLGDIKKALGADHTRGGYAIDTLFVSNDVIITDLTSEKCGLILILQVDYETEYGNPYVN